MMIRSKGAAEGGVHAITSAMIFGTPPAFEEVMASIEALERHLNTILTSHPDQLGPTAP